MQHMPGVATRHSIWASGSGRGCGVLARRASVTLQWPALTISEEKSEIPVCMSKFPFLNDHRAVLKYHVGQTQLGAELPKDNVGICESICGLCFLVYPRGR